MKMTPELIALAEQIWAQLRKIEKMLDEFTWQKNSR